MMNPDWIDDNGETPSMTNEIKRINAGGNQRMMFFFSFCSLFAFVITAMLTLRWMNE